MLLLLKVLNDMCVFTGRGGESNMFIDRGGGPTMFFGRGGVPNMFTGRGLDPNMFIGRVGFQICLLGDVFNDCYMF